MTQWQWVCVLLLNVEWNSSRQRTTSNTCLLVAVTYQMKDLAEAWKTVHSNEDLTARQKWLIKGKTSQRNSIDLPNEILGWIHKPNQRNFLRTGCTYQLKDLTERWIKDISEILGWLTKWNTWLKDWIPTKGPHAEMGRPRMSASWKGRTTTTAVMPSSA